ncbi:MAG TPA: UDP-N-acetylenolpyruvoylglucosamine reductase, partial [Gammaproteobacteria bacterium]|nr:UDP-N-acetylenolpyruvoylglucosamine reductase [Gammaproteobacteria bacterium]
QMNAGAFGGETWDRVLAVTCVNRQGEILQRTREDFEIGYRQVIPRAHKAAQEGFFGATFLLTRSNNSEKITDNIRALIQKRNKTQPIGTFNCGSVFKNPPGDHAARLIECAGLKGLRQGDAVVSTKHANFIINEGKAKACDVETLIQHIQSEVFTKFQIHLKTEVHIIGIKEGDCL